MLLVRQVLAWFTSRAQESRRNTFPLATVSVLFAARYKAVESEAASMLLVSTLTLAIKVPAILWLSNDSETELQPATASRV